MTFTEAAIWVLRLANKPLHFKEITEVAIERSLLSHVGKNPEVTMGARLSAQVKKNEKENPLARVKPGVFALTDWDEKTVAAGLANRTPAIELVRQAEADGVVVPVAEVSEEQHESSESDENEPDMAEATDAPPSIAPPPDDEEIHRAELSAAATELFEPEEDDDQPIFGAAPEADSDSDDEPKEGRRRRRRRRGKRRDGEGDGEDGEDDMPAYTVSDAPSDEVLAEVLDESPQLGLAAPSLGLSGQLAQALSKYDGNRGPVSAQGLADSLKKGGGPDRTLSGAGILAVAAAENYSRELRGEAPLFRITGSKLGLFAWSFEKKAAEKLLTLGRLSQELRSSTQKSLADQIGKLQQRAFGELVLALLDRMGLLRLSVVKRPGTHGAELHFSAQAPLSAYGISPGQEAKGGVPVAVCVRRDGKDVGRERVTELRGALHHYEGASQGWLITSGQILSGAREEACSTGASPMVLIGRSELAELCLIHGVGVRMHRVEVPVVDTALFDSLSGR